MGPAMRPLRLDRVLANLGYGTRSTVPVLIRGGRVSVDGRVARDPSMKVDPMLVTLDGGPADHPHGVLVAFNKPAGAVCSHDASEGPRIYDLLPPRWLDRTPQVTSIGRLDRDTTGLVLITDDAPLVHRLISPKHHIRKTYEAVLDRPIPSGASDLFASGSLILKGESAPCAPALLELTGESTATITMTEGRYHQVRRMFAAVGVHVVALHRRAFGPVSLAPAARAARPASGLEPESAPEPEAGGSWPSGPALTVSLEEGAWCDLPPTLFSSG